MGSNAIFLSYRRADSADISGRIYDHLVERFGAERVFKDVDSIRPGVVFADYIVDSIGQSAVEFVIIGPRWLTISAGWNRRRLDDPDDFVRIEIETALRAGVPIIPLLVMGAVMPPAQRLPESLKRLTERDALRVRPDPDFQSDMERVIEAADYWMRQPRPETAVRAPADMLPTTARGQAPHAPIAVKPRRAQKIAAIILLALLVVLLGSLLYAYSTINTARLASIDATHTANTASTGSANVAATAYAEETQAAYQRETQTAEAPTQTAQAIAAAFPYHEADPGCSPSTAFAQWNPPTPQSGAQVTCQGAYTRYVTNANSLGSSDNWPAAATVFFPQDYTVSIQTRNLSANAEVGLTVQLGYGSGGMAQMYLDADRGAATASYCPTGASSCPNYSLPISYQGVHTLAITVSKTGISFQIDGKTITHLSTPSAEPTTQISFGVSNSSASADFLNFSVIPVSG